jgi:hypothetical protein
MSVEANFRESRPATSLRMFFEVLAEEGATARAAGEVADPIFRGHRRETWKLAATAGRERWKGELENVERLAFEEFKRTSPRLHHLVVEDDWDRLAIAQHHGLPTRLLDWTYSALAALYFTVNKTPSGVEGGAVWRLQTRKEDFEIPTPDPLSITDSCIYRPRYIADRIQAQAGLFVAHAVKTVDGVRDFIPLETNSVFTDRLVKIPVPRDCFVTLRDELHVCGIHEFTVYPDLQGLTTHLTWRYSHGKKP